MSTEPLRVVYILGRGRSGSTIAESLLARKTHLPMLGEARLWPLVYSADHACSCGAPTVECPFWEPVLSAFSDRSRAEASFRRMISRRFLLAGFIPKAILRRAYAKEIAALGELYGSISRIHGSPAVIDSSKNPVYALVLSLVPGVRVSLLHVVRHPLGVAFSWQRQRARARNARLYDTRKSTGRVALEWLGSNLFSEVAKLRIPGVHKAIRYEALEDEFDALCNWIESDSDRPRPDSSQMHAISGNPGQSARAESFKVDEAWREDMHLSDKILCWALTGPLFLFYAVRL